MAGDLVREDLKPGMPLKEVRILLGPPDEIDRGLWVYNVDRKRDGLSYACVTLELRTAHGRVRTASIESDG
jgi:hypothetical protein